MKPHKPGHGGQDPNQGEGDRIAAGHYNREVREFVADGKVEEAARDAKDFVEREPAEAQRAERAAQRGPSASRLSVDDLVAKARSVVDRVKPALQSIRSRLSRK
ncbi:MAG: hypothetical protein WKG01_27605 [Kofleriaceae bacterium]